MPGPIAFGEIRDHDASGSGACGMDEAVVPEIDADMRNAVAHDAEENEIARLESASLMRFPIRLMAFELCGRDSPST